MKSIENNQEDTMTTIIPTPAAHVQPGQTVRCPDGQAFYEIVKVVKRRHPETMGWSGGYGVKLSTGWGSCILDAEDTVDVLVVEG